MPLLLSSSGQTAQDSLIFLPVTQHVAAALNRSTLLCFSFLRDGDERMRMEEFPVGKGMDAPLPLLSIYCKSGIITPLSVVALRCVIDRQGCLGQLQYRGLDFTVV